MQTLGKMIVLFLLTFQLAYSGSVEASVSTMEAVEGNVVKLQIKAIGEDIEFPQIDDVAGAPVVGTSTQSSSNFTYVNGDIKSEKATIKVIGFLPKKDMTIPSYTVQIDGKPYQTKPLEIKVVASKAPQLKADSAYSFELKTEKTEVMAGESFILTLYINISDRMQGAQLADFADPQMDGFYSKALNEPQQYHQNGYTVVEKKYLLTANKDGNFTIKPAKARLGEADMRRRDFFGRYATQWYDIASNDLFIQVKPQAKKSDLIGEFKLDASIDADEVKANKPVNLTVKIEGKGNLEDFEFPAYEIDGVTVYSDDANVESRVENGELYSTYSKSFALISDRGFTVPARSFSVWNSTTSSLQKLEVPSYQIKVKEDKGALEATTPTANVTPQKAEENPLPQPSSGSVTETKIVHEVAWWMIAAAFVAGMMIMLLFLKLSSLLTQKRSKIYHNDEALRILYPHINEDRKIEEMVRKLYAKKNGDKSVVIDKKALKELIQKVQQ